MTRTDSKVVKELRKKSSDFKGRTTVVAPAQRRHSSKPKPKPEESVVPVKTELYACLAHEVLSCVDQLCTLTPLPSSEDGDRIRAEAKAELVAEMKGEVKRLDEVSKYAKYARSKLKESGVDEHIAPARYEDVRDFVVNLHEKIRQPNHVRQTGRCKCPADACGNKTKDFGYGQALLEHSQGALRNKKDIEHFCVVVHLSMEKKARQGGKISKGESTKSQADKKAFKNQAKKRDEIDRNRKGIPSVIEL
mmetsp:Transcript_7008/g.16766  ORF Transcript_7008/g.16766 Transcript_7008/m.16766 type:complete len:249 (+) Transcript_7008:50-796(+)